ncbi:MAG: EamA family transporter [Chthonomonadales bacterium]
MDWRGYAGLSALFAGITAILAKIGIQDIPSNVGTFIRTIVILLFAGAIIVATGEWSQIKLISNRTLLFLVLLGLATGASWLCYFAALKTGKVQEVAPIDKLSFVLAMFLAFVFLGERPKPTQFAGAAFIAFGVLLTLRK